MSVAFKRPFNGETNLDGQFSVRSFAVNHFKGDSILEAQQDFVKVNQLKFFDVGTAGETDFDNDWHINANETRVDIGRDDVALRDEYAGRNFLTVFSSFTQTKALQLRGGGPANIDPAGDPDGNEFDDEKYRSFIHFDDSDGVENAGTQWSLSMYKGDHSESELNKTALLLLCKDHDSGPYYQGHAFFPEKFHTRNVVIKPEEESYVPGGGADRRSRANFIRFDHGRNWSISCETDRIHPSSNDNGVISSDALFFRCGAGGDDQAVMALVPGGVFSKIPAQSWGNEDDAVDADEWPMGTFIWNSAQGELWFKAPKDSHTGQECQLIKIGADASSEKKTNGGGFRFGDYYVSSGNNDGVDGPNPQNPTATDDTANGNTIGV